MKLHRPENLPEAFSLLGSLGEDAKLLAGGTAFTIFHKLGMISPDHLVSLGRIDSLRGVMLTKEFLTIGAMTRLRDLEENACIAKETPVLARLLKLVANIRVRNMATLGGNLVEGDPTTDPPAILIALGSEVRLVSPNGERWVPLENFFLGHFDTVVESDEVLTEVRIPRRDVRASYLKFVSRHAEDRTCLGVAAVIEVADGGSIGGLSVGLVGGDQTPLVVRVMAEELSQAPLSKIYAEVAERFRVVAEPVSDSRGTAAYKRMVIPSIVTDALVRAESGRQEASRW